MATHKRKISKIEIATELSLPLAALEPWKSTAILRGAEVLVFQSDKLSTWERGILLGSHDCLLQTTLFDQGLQQTA